MSHPKEERCQDRDRENRQLRIRRAVRTSRRAPRLEPAILHIRPQQRRRLP